MKISLEAFQSIVDNSSEVYFRRMEVTTLGHDRPFEGRAYNKATRYHVGQYNMSEKQLPDYVKVDGTVYRVDNGGAIQIEDRF